MRLRTAIKIMGNVSSGRESCYRGDTVKRAIRRYERSKEARYADAFWNALMDTIGPAGRAQVIQRDMPGAALRLLCEEVEGLNFQ